MSCSDFDSVKFSLTESIRESVNPRAQSTICHSQGSIYSNSRNILTDDCDITAEERDEE